MRDRGHGAEAALRGRNPGTAGAGDYSATPLKLWLNSFQIAQSRGAGTRAHQFKFSSMTVDDLVSSDGREWRRADSATSNPAAKAVVEAERQKPTLAKLRPLVGSPLGGQRTLNPEASGLRPGIVERGIAGRRAPRCVTAGETAQNPLAKARDEAEAVGIDRATYRKVRGAAKAERVSRELGLRKPSGGRRLLQRKARPCALGGDVTGGERPATNFRGGFRTLISLLALPIADARRAA